MRGVSTLLDPKIAPRKWRLSTGIWQIFVVRSDAAILLGDSRFRGATVGDPWHGAGSIRSPFAWNDSDGAGERWCGNRNPSGRKQESKSHQSPEKSPGKSPGKNADPDFAWDTCCAVHQAGWRYLMQSNGLANVEVFPGALRLPRLRRCRIPRVRPLALPGLRELLSMWGNLRAEVVEGAQGLSWGVGQYPAVSPKAVYSSCILKGALMPGLLDEAHARGGGERGR
ncbi:hypothetical protein SAMN06296416_11297 [Pseudoxanthomonas wuyuanensis]|uniref:Uncharacterized protein n=1 Tax=Pseudoxanthomonas wuyuanensis TaxID=1073196 RepID=A0A286DF89_9GAMM|nr:hypothetical protein SAMN06296416_11297 [Pseudoxanthomonas wuyuanensis]